MIRMILAFLVVFALFFVGIPVFRKMSGQERINVLKVVLYSLLCAILAVGTLSIIVVLF